MNKEKFFSLFFLLILACAFYQLFRIFEPFLSTAFWAFVIVFAFLPLFDFLRKLFRENRFWAALVMTVFLFSIIVVPLIFLIFYLSGGALDLYHSAKELVTTGSWHRFVDFCKHNPVADYLKREWFKGDLFVGQQLDHWLLDGAKKGGEYAAAHSAGLMKKLILSPFRFILLMVFVFIFFNDGKIIYDFIYRLIPMSEKNKTELFETLNTTFKAIIRGQFLTSVIQAAAATLVFLFLNIQPFLLFGLLTFVASLIPIIGAAGVWVPIDIYLFVTGNVHLAVLLLICGVAGISSIDHVTKPLFIGQHSKLSFVLIFFGILGGIAAYGVTGIFIGPIVLAVFFTLIKMFYEHYLA